MHFLHLSLSLFLSLSLSLSLNRSISIFIWLRLRTHLQVNTSEQRSLLVFLHSHKNIFKVFCNLSCIGSVIGQKFVVNSMLERGSGKRPKVVKTWCQKVRPKIWHFFARKCEPGPELETFLEAQSRFHNCFFFLTTFPRGFKVTQVGVENFFWHEIKLFVKENNSWKKRFKNNFW